MPLHPQVIDVYTGGGIDERSGKKGALPTKWRALQNARWTYRSEVEKRLGNTIVGNAIDGNAIVVSNDNARLMACGDHLLLADGYQLASLEGVGQAMLGVGKIPEAVVTRAGIAGDTSGVTNVDVAYCSSGTYSGCLAYVWASGAVGSATITVRLFNATTGAPVRSATVAAGDVGNPKVVFVNGEIVVTYTDSTTGIYCFRVTSSATSNPITNKLSSGYPSANYDVCATATRFYVVYQKSGGAPDIVVNGYDSTATLKTTGTSAEASGGSKSAFGICATVGESIWVSASTASGVVKAFAFNLAEPALTETTAPFTILNSSDTIYTTCPARGASSTKASVVIGTSFFTTYSAGRTYVSHITTSGTEDGAATSRITHWAMPASRPFWYQDTQTTQPKTTMYCWLTVGSADATLSSWGSATSPWLQGQLSLVLVDLNADDPTFTVGPARPVAVSAARFAAIQRTNVSSVVSPSTKKYVMGGMVAHDTRRTKISCVRLTADFAHVNRWQPARLGEDLYLGGGVVNAYDGGRVYEAPFVYYPEKILSTDSATGGSLVALSSYSYVAVYAWGDGNGNIMRSAPSAARTHTLGSGKTGVDLTIPYLSLTTKRSGSVGSSNTPPITIEIYRTTANSSGPYYLLSSSSTNVVASPVLSFTDTTADSSITSNPQLYTGLNGTDTSIVANVCPPSCTSLLAHNGCLWAIGDDERTVWVSKPNVDGEMVGWMDTATIPFDENIRLVALAPLDNVVIAFSRNRIYQIVGTSPSGAVGDGGSLEVRRITSDFGCIDARSVCVTPDGVIFQSSGGYYLLDRGLNVMQAFGDDVQTTLGTYSTVTSAVVHPSGKFILVTCHSGGTTGVRLVYDYRQRQWGTDKLRGYSTADVRVLSSAAVGDYLYWIDKDGYVYRELLASESNPYLDNGYWVTFQAETQDIKLAGLQGYQRVWKVGLLGARYTSHDLTIEIATDYATSFAQSKAFTSTSTDAWPIEECQVHVVRQLCEAVRVRVTDATPTGGSVTTGQGFALSGLALEVGVMPKVFRMPSAQRG